MPPSAAVPAGRQQRVSDVLCLVCVTLAALLITVLMGSGLSLWVGDGYQQKELDLWRASGENFTFTEDGKLLVGGAGARVELRGLDIHTKTIYIRLSSEEGEPFMVSADLDISDESYLAAFAPADRMLFSPTGAQNAGVWHFASNGRAQAVQLAFAPCAGSFTIESVQLNVGGFRFSFVKFLVLTALGLCIWAVPRFGLHKSRYNAQNPWHRAALAAGLVIFLLLLAALLLAERARADDLLTVEYYAGRPLESDDFYYWLFDSFRHGRLDMLTDPDPALLEMANPYDRTLRHALGAPYPYDAALYDGRFYVYYGAPPVLVYQLVYLFCGRLPTPFFACTLLAAAAAWALYQAYKEWLHRFAPKPNLLLAALGFPALVFGSLVGQLWIAGDKYCLPYLAGIACMGGFIALGYRAARIEKTATRRILFALAGVLYVGMVASRPPMALMGIALLAPLFLKHLADGAQPVRARWADAGVFVAPVALGAALLMAYNAARFGSPFEFGTHYQLTIADMNTARLMPAYTLPAMLYYYFLMPLAASARFPFLRAQWSQLLTVGNYFYNWESFGLFTLPVYWGLPLAFAGRGGSAGPGEDEGRLFRRTAALVMAASLVVAYVNFSMGGIIFRYLCDFAPTLALLAVAAMLRYTAPDEAAEAACVGAAAGGEDAAALPAQRPKTRRVAACLALCLATLFVAGCLLFGNWWNRLYNDHPDFYISMADFMNAS